MFTKIPVILLAVIISAIFLESYIPMNVLSLLYAVSLTIKSLIIFLLPAVVFMLLFKTVAQLSGRATKIILFLLGAICASNFISTFISYGIGSSITHLNLAMSVPQIDSNLLPAWNLSFPKWLRTDYAMFAGLLFGLLNPFGEKLTSYFDKTVNQILKVILWLIPLFIAGFMMKLIHDKVIQNIVYDYAPIFGLVVAAQFGYVSLLYLIANRFSLSGFASSIKNMFPAAVAGFGSMSSAAALPLTLIGAEKNTGPSPMTKLAIPTTSNVHLIGDCLAIPIFALAIMKSFGMPDPSFLSYFIFACYFVLAKFSVAAIPGGGILVMIPILERQFGFTSEMSSLITAFYILFDPIITTANITGNGAFAMLLQFFKKSPIMKTS